MKVSIGNIMKTGLALSWLAFEVMFLFSISTMYGENQANHYIEFAQCPDGMMATLNRDITVREVGKLENANVITIKAGTVVHPKRMWNGVVFSYQGECDYSAKLEDFKEQDQLKKIIDETNERVREKREQIVRENIDLRGITAGVCWLLIGSVLTFVLVKKEKHALLFVIHAALIPVFSFAFCSVLSTLCH